MRAAQLLHLEGIYHGSLLKGSKEEGFTITNNARTAEMARLTAEGEAGAVTRKEKAKPLTRPVAVLKACLARAPRKSQDVRFRVCCSLILKILIGTLDIVVRQRTKF